MLTRRNLIASAAVLPAGGLLASCAGVPPPLANGGINPAFVDAVVAALQSGCAIGLSFIPTAVSIADVVASLFGAGAVATVQLISGAVTSVASEICSSIPTAPPAVAALRRRLLKSSYALPVYVGTTPHGVVVTGWQAH